MSRPGIRFWIPETPTDVEAAEVETLHEELERLAATNKPRPDVTALIDRLQLQTADLDRDDAQIFEPSDRERAILLRAAEHLRHLKDAPALTTLRDRISGTGGVKWISYRLQFVDARSPQDFTSYSLAYAVGDRLVTAEGQELRVIGIRAGNPDVLLVATWHADKEPPQRVSHDLRL